MENNPPVTETDRFLEVIFQLYSKDTIGIASELVDRDRSLGDESPSVLLSRNNQSSGFQLRIPHNPLG